MSATPTNNRNDSENATSIRPVSVTMDATAGQCLTDGLDRDHHSRVDDVKRCDTSEDRDQGARTAIGLLNEESQELLAGRNALGSDEHVEACRRCRWFPYQLKLALGSRLAWLLDGGLWAGLWGGLWWMWVRYYQRIGEAVPGWLYFPGVLAVPIVAYFCATVAKGLGQHVAVTRLTNPRSVADTVDRQVRITGLAAMAAGLLLLGILALLFFAPASWSSWVTYVSGMLGFGANIALGLSAGIGGNAAHLLAKPAERDTIDCALDMKDQTRQQLRRFLLVVLVALGMLFQAPGVVAGGGWVWVWAIDATSSLDPAQREAGIVAMSSVAGDRAEAIGARTILVIRFSNDSVLADMTWIPVPARPARKDCDRATPDAILSKSLIGLSPSVAEGRRQAAVAACLAQQREEQDVYTRELERFREQLRAASQVVPKSDVSTRIIPLLRRFASRSYVVAIDCLSDGVDNSGMPLSSLRIPERVPVTMVLGRPDPRRHTPTLDDVLRAADAWSRVPGVSVTSVSEYTGFSRFAEAR